MLALYLQTNDLANCAALQITQSFPLWPARSSSLFSYSPCQSTYLFKTWYYPKTDVDTAEHCSMLLL